MYVIRIMIESGTRSFPCPNKTPETMDRHMIVPKLLRMRIWQKSAVGTLAKRLVPAALMMVGPRW